MERSVVNPPSLMPAKGYAHAVVFSGAGRIVSMAGQAGMDAQGRVVPGGLVAQFDQALANVVEVLKAVGGTPENVGRCRIYVSDREEYRRKQREVGAAWRRHFGKWYPASILVEVTGFWDPEQVMELECDAYLP